MKKIVNNPVMMALLCVFAWSFIPVVSKLGQSGIDNTLFLFWSNLFSCIVLLPTIRFSKLSLRQSLACLKGWGLILNMVLGLLGCCVYYLCLYYGYEAHDNAVQVLVIQYLWPALITVLAVFLLHEAFNLAKGLSIIFGFIAAVLAVTGGDFSGLKLSKLVVLAVVLAGAFAFALFSVLSKFEKRADSAFAIFLYFVWGTVFSALAVTLFSEWRLPDNRSWLMILLNGAFVNGITYPLWVNALAKADASKLSPLVYLSPVLSMIWIAFFFHQGFTIVNVVAMGFAITSGLLIIERKVGKAKP